jgi:hypothetical protein
VSTNIFGNITKEVGSMLEKLFGNVVIEKIFFYLLMNKDCYASQLKDVFNIPLFSIQTALGRLEKGGIVVRQSVGRTQVYQFNPRYPFLDELQIFLKRAYSFLPEDLRSTYYEPAIRKRPRRKGKPLEE